MENPFSHLEDGKLMELYKQGESMAFEVLYARHKDRVYTYLHKRLLDQEHIDDVFQNIFIKFHKSRDKFDNKYNLLQWLYTISRSELLDFTKKKKLQLIEFNEENLETVVEEKFEFDINEFNSLSSNEKEAIILKYYSDKDYLEISNILNTSESNARKLVSRGLKKIKNILLGGQNETAKQ